MRGITRAFRGRLAKMERVCNVGEFDHMSMEELQDFCESEVLSLIEDFGGNEEALVDFIRSEKKLSIKDNAASCIASQIEGLIKKAKKNMKNN